MTSRPLSLPPSPAAALALLAVLCVSCLDPAGEALSGRRVEPLDVYDGWWSSVQACSGREGELELIRWFEANVLHFDGVSAFGLWRAPHDIFLAVGSRGDEFVVKHEMLHDLLSGDPGHAASAWRACGLGAR